MADKNDVKDNGRRHIQTFVIEHGPADTVARERSALIFSASGEGGPERLPDDAEEVRSEHLPPGQRAEVPTINGRHGG